MKAFMGDGMTTYKTTNRAAEPHNQARAVFAAGGDPPTYMELGKEILDTAKDKITTKSTDEGNTPQADATVNPFAEMEQQAQDARTSLVSSGIDPALYDPYIQALESIPLTQPVAAQVLKTFLNTAMETGADPQLVIGIGVAVAMRAKSLSAANPKRITDVVDAAMGTLSKYEQRLPGRGIFQVASDAAHGRPFMNYLTQLRLLMVPQGIEYTQSADLVRTLMALVTPNDPQAGKMLDEYSSAKTRYQQQKIELGSNFARMYAAYETERDKYLRGLLAEINKRMPSIVANGMMKLYMKGIFAASSVSALNNLRKQYFGGTQNNPLQTGLHGEGSTPLKKASDETMRTRRFAQVNPAAQNPMGTPPQQTVQQQQAGNGAYSINSGLTNTMNGANAGQAPQNLQQDVIEGQQGQQIGVDQRNLSTLFNQKLAMFKASYERVLGMSSVQTLAPTDSGNAENMMSASNFAGGTIATVAAQTMLLGASLAHDLDQYTGMLQAGNQRGEQAAQQSMQYGAADGNQQQSFQMENIQAGNQSQVNTVYWMRADVDEKMRTLKSIQVMAPVTDYIRQQIPTIESLELDIQASGGKQSTSGVVGQLAGLCYAVAKQFVPIIGTYANVSSAAKDPNTKGWATQQYKYAALYRKRWMVKALTYVRQMKEGKWGAGVSSGLASVDTGRVSSDSSRTTRFASETDFLRLADKEIEDYLNDLYGDTDASGYGTLLEHIEDHENDTSHDVEPEPKGDAGQEQHIEKKLKHRRFR